MNDMTPPATGIKSASDRLRAEWANSLALCLNECHPADAAAICAAYLQDAERGGPNSAFGPIRADAIWWAETAPPHELQEHVLAGMRILASRALGPTARRKFIAALWSGLDPNDRADFIARVAVK